MVREQFSQLDDKLDEIDSAIDNLLKKVGIDVICNNFYSHI